MSKSVLTASTLALCAGLVASANAQTAFSETEPNETKAQANVVVLTGPGDTIVGNTTGTSTTVPGAASADTFRVKTPPAALGIYRHRLVLTTSGTAGHTGTIRGTGQANGAPNATDAAAQTSSTTTTPARFNQWYGFGKEEQIYYRVTGTASTTADYVSTYSVDPVTPFDAGTFFAGDINIGEATGSTMDVDFWVYDSNLNAIPGYGVDNPENLTLTFTPGVYYIAWSNFNFASNQPARLLTPPSTYDFAGTMLDFPNAASNSSTTNIANANLQISDETGPRVFPFTRPDPFGIIWVQMTVVTPPVSGACCRSSGACQIMSPAGCTAAGGTYNGDGSSCGTVTCAQPGACCLPDGTCSFGLATACTTAGGVFRGEGVQCDTVECPQPAGQIAEGLVDAGELPASARVTVGTGPLNTILGNASAPQDVDMYKIRIVDEANFTASTVNAATTWDTQLFVFNEAGLGVEANDDEVGGTTLQSRLTTQFVNASGQHYLAISRFNRDPASGGTSPIFNQVTSRSEVAATGAGAGAPVDAWINTVTAAAGSYRITLTGVEFSEAGATPCYANCDGSTIAPVLNVLDFNCFLNSFAAGASYANCDGSTIAPVLNVLDFNCFLNRFAAGCTNP